MPKSITNLIANNIKNNLILHLDHQISPDIAIASSISFIDQNLDVIENVVAANFQFTSISFTENVLAIGDVFGCIHVLTEGGESNNVLSEQVEEGAAIKYYKTGWQSGQITERSIEALSYSPLYQSVACLDNQEILSNHTGSWTKLFTTNEPVTFCINNSHGTTVVAAHNEIYLINNDNVIKLDVPLNGLPRVTFTDIVFYGPTNESFYITAKNGYVLSGNVHRKALLDIELPIHQYYSIDIIDDDKLVLALNKDGIAIVTPGQNTFDWHDIHYQSFRLAVGSQRFFVSTEESDLQPKIVALDFSPRTITQVKDVKIK